MTPLAVRRLGPFGDFAADGAFGSALTTLWQAVTRAGGAVGFIPESPRQDIAAAAAATVQALQSGRSHAVALLDGRVLVGFAVVDPGSGLVAHTGYLRAIMVAPERQGQGLGRMLMTALLELCRDLHLERVDLAVRDGLGLDQFYRSSGFNEYGRRPGWVKLADGSLADTVHLWRMV